ncbi:uncharacterized protein LOC107473943 [Arachis duranensis]|uniref:ATP-dependent DNA helicase n=1 Tax=Arachis duranensis TaxID=130453 RepID=A0A6P4CCB1_ARADU|nr:uncharacterized protein LOC107473943 [Arachis duranensis]
MVEAERLQYHRFHQSKFRSHQLQGLHECLSQGETQDTKTGKRVILPSSFVCRLPSYFITITCNPDWNEVKDCVADYSLKPSDRPDIISRVFKIKLDALLKDLKDGSIFGKPKGIVYIVEFHKRDLPNCHILLFIQSAEKPRSSDDIDHHISAVILDEHTQHKLYRLVQKFMVHGPCGVLNTSSLCMVNGRCSKFYPMPFREKIAIDSVGFPMYKRSDNGRSTSKRNVNLDNWFIVLYNATLLLKYGCHINVEYTCQTSAIKYLFKYVHKGNDRVTASFFRLHDSVGSNVTVDEIQNYYDCRYISACEASWRLFGFEIQFKEPNVIRLPFHLPNEQNVLYEDHQLIENVIEAAVSKDSMFIGWFKANKDFDLARTLTYAEMLSFFVWDKQGHMWRPRKQGNVIGRLTHIPHSHGEEYCLRLLLNYQKGCHTFADVRSVDGIVYDTFKEACYALGFQCSVHEIKSITLAKIKKLLQPNGRSLKEFTDMLFPDCVASTEPSNTVFFYELNFDKTELASISIDLVSRLNRDQRVAFDTIANAVSRGAGGFFFGCGYGGTGKTFLWNTLSTSIRSKGDIVLNVASSGNAVLLLPNGRTAHSRFKVPLSVNQDSICNIRQDTPLARLISSAKLIIWDEAPMLNKFCFEALDKCLKDVLRFDRGYNPDAPFGGKIVVMGGDFRQILPLTENMRLCRDMRDIHGVQLGEFAEWLLQIGDGLDYFKGRSILAPTLDVVTKVNNHVMSLIPGNERVYLSSDTLINEDGHLEFELYTMCTESLNALNCSGIPQHLLVLKISVPVMLLRNIDQSNGLCNGTRMQIRRLGDHIIECIILAGCNTGEVVFIPRMNMSPNNDTLPIRFTRRQFSVALCFAMTINKSQGQTLSTVGVYLPRPVFTHGQLYVALFRVSMHFGLKILSVGSNSIVSDHTINVVYREVFAGLLPDILP